jgi:hypothetical protein
VLGGEQGCVFFFATEYTEGTEKAGQLWCDLVVPMRAILVIFRAFRVFSWPICLCL